MPSERAAIYARYSSDLQKPTSIEDQIRICRERALALRLSVEDRHVYSDAAISGSALLNRPAIKCLLAAANAGEIDVVIAEAQDRLSRDLEDIAGVFKRLRHAGVRIVTVGEGEISLFHVGVKGAMNEAFLDNMKKRVRRGQRGQIERGRAAGGISYGYRVVRRFGTDGKPVNGLREINEEEAAVVRRAATLYLDGRSARMIAGIFNEEGIPAPRGKGWNASTINGNAGRGNGLLHNELYVGKLVYNRQTHSRHPDTGRRVARFNPRTEWVIVDAPELRILDDATWNAIQTRHRQSSTGGMTGSGRMEAVRQARRPRHLLSGLLRCGVCGGPLTVVTTGYLGCSHHRERRTCTNTRKVKVDRVENGVIDGLRTHLLSPGVVAAAIREYRAALDRDLGQAEARRGERDRKITRLDKAIRRIVDLICNGTETPELRRRLVEMEQEKADLEQQARVEDASGVVALHPDAGEKYETMVQDLAASLNRDDTRHEAMSLLRSLIDSVTLHPGPRQGEFEVELDGQMNALQQAAAGLSAAGQAPQFVKKFMLKVATPRGFEPLF